MTNIHGVPSALKLADRSWVFACLYTAFCIYKLYCTTLGLSVTCCVIAGVYIWYTILSSIWPSGKESTLQISRLGPPKAL